MAIGGFFKVAPDQLDSKQGVPSETSKSIVEIMIEQQREIVAAKKAKERKI